MGLQDLVGSAGFLLIAGLVGYALVAKLRTGIRGFAAQVAEYQLLPAGWNRPVAVSVIIGELTGTALLVWSKTRPFALSLIVCLLTSFAVAQILAWHKGRTILCGCFGATGELDIVGAGTIVRTLMLLALTLWVFLKPPLTMRWLSIPFACLLALVLVLTSQVATLFIDYPNRSRPLHNSTSAV